MPLRGCRVGRFSQRDLRKLSSPTDPLSVICDRLDAVPEVAYLVRSSAANQLMGELGLVLVATIVALKLWSTSGKKQFIARKGDLRSRSCLGADQRNPCLRDLSM